VPFQAIAKIDIYARTRVRLFLRSHFLW